MNALKTESGWCDMAFGDSWVIETIPIPLSVKLENKFKQCCDDPINMSVANDTGLCYCLKCKENVSIEHFDEVLEQSARNTPGLRWKYR